MALAIEACRRCGGRMFEEQPDALVRKPDLVCLMCGWRLSAMPAIELDDDAVSTRRQARPWQAKRWRA